MKHTPGPWFYYVHGIRHKVFANTVDHMICDIKATQDDLANAKLIAAAPELLEALQRMISPFNGIAAIPSKEITVTYSLEDIQAAQAAIKKATS